MSDLPKKAKIRYLMPDGTRPIYIASDGGANAALNIQAKFENITVEPVSYTHLTLPTTPYV